MEKETYIQWRTRTLGREEAIKEDGFDAEALLQLPPQEQEEVRQRLLDGIEQQDWIAAEALRVFYPTDLIAKLREYLPKAKHLFRLSLACLLNEIDPENEEDYFDAVLDVLNSPLYEHRAEAAAALCEFSPELATDVLLDVVREDPEYTVRYQAADSFLALYNLGSVEDEEHDDVFTRITDLDDWQRTTKLDVERFESAARILSQKVKDTP